MKQQTFAASETLTKNKEIIDYSGKTIYVGIDVHQKDYQVAKLCNGVILGNHRMKADGGELIKHLKSHYPGAEFKCVYESCSWGFNLQRKLTAAGINCIVVHAADVASTDKEKKRKSDKVDASKLARQLASGDLTPIHVPDETNQKHRNLIRYRFKLVGNINKCKNRVKSLLKFQGIEIPEQFGEKKCWSKVFISWLEQQSVADPDVGMTLALMIEELKFLRQLLLKTEKKLKDLRNNKYDKEVKLVISVVGIGPTTAMAFVLEVGDIRRFRGFDALNDFIGFCPDKHGSGDTDRDMGITKRSHKKLRSLLIESAWVAIRTDPALMNSYEALCKRMKGTRAITRIARKLLRRLRTVLITGVEYQKGVVA